MKVKKIREWVKTHTPSDYIRENDTIYHNVLEYNPKTNEIKVGLYSQGEYTEGWEQLYEFANGQDFANIDMSYYTDYSDVEEKYSNIDIFNIDEGHPLYEEIEKAKRQSEIEGYKIEEDTYFNNW